MSKPAGLCAYCGREGDLTKQHLIPDRLKRLVPRKASEHYQLITHVRSSGSPPPRAEIKKRQGHLGTRRLRRVCNPCNTTWLKGIEERAFDLLTPLILGEDRTLSVEEQADVALMAATMAATIDLDDAPSSGVSQAERTFLREMSEVPPNWHVMMVRIEGEIWSTRWVHYGLHLVPKAAFGSVGPNNAQITTIGMGKTLLQVVSLPQEIRLPWAKFAWAVEVGLIHPAGGPFNPSSLPVIHDDDCDILSELWLNQFYEWFSPRA